MSGARQSKTNNTGLPDESPSGLYSEKITDYSGTAEPMLPVAEVSSVQLRPGPAPTNLSIFSSGKVGVLGVHHHAPSVGIVILKQEYFGFMWWDGENECRINGELARSTTIHVQGEQDGFHATGGARRTMGIAVRRKDLIETLAALRGVAPEDVVLDHDLLDIPPDAARRFRSGIDSHLKAFHSGPADPGEEIFNLLVDAYLLSTPELIRGERSRKPELLVRQAEERFFETPDQPVSLTDLCVATGASQSTLYRAFNTVCGESPLAYFYKRRLTNARRILVNTPPFHGAVKQAALGVGLTEFGRFALEYRRLFGESPSATLRKDAKP